MKLLRFVAGLLLIGVGILATAYGVLSLIDSHNFLAGKYSQEGTDALGSLIIVAIGLATGIQGLGILPGVDKDNGPGSQP